MFHFFSNDFYIKREYVKILRVNLCVMVTPILDSLTLTGAAFLVPVPKMSSSQAYVLFLGITTKNFHLIRL